ncbi:MAG: zinc-dependent metalloprotease [Tessaracoccus sp.]|uniref:zinc-dependent metalloprotease n=1 Tax=Tessaracoccus sp. TaxID=1971211 RepID=UPI001EBB9185|nr:zinc-dependent metalloprotease [Tessaracoccus sp.]MBK7822589.1 zinc-dependent metalloprotease [Tessaracoccus sp.]
MSADDAPAGTFAPTVDWALARRVARLGSRDLPGRSLPELRQLVAGLRVTARRAGEAGADYLGLDSVGAGTVRVVDWTGWAEAVRAMTDGVVTDLGLPARAPGALTTLRGFGSGLALGAGLRFVSRRLLGQYDGYTGSDTLYLVAPTILRLERAHGFVPADFRLWVSLHEQTHALQFRAAPWLRAHLMEGARAVLDDDSSLLEGLIGWARTGDPAAIIATGEGAERLAGMVATMTFLEGHADHVADEVGRRLVPTVKRLRKAFSRTGSGSRLGRLAGSLNKDAQYREGLEFCRRVTRRGGPEALRAAFAAPETLPKPEEIADPEAWLRRVHG